MVLLPLLGITNALVMIKAPLDRSAVEFALWSYSSHFLTSFQGFFVALLYCFLNGEVSENEIVSLVAISVKTIRVEIRFARRWARNCTTT